MSIAPAIEQHYPGLNDAQRAIVGHLDGPLLVIAGPGSGKTFSIVLRALNLLLLEKAHPRQLALCTFTEKAAFEMRDRLTAAARKVGFTGDLSELPVSTIHSFCNRVLMQHRHRTELGHSFDTLDELTQLLCIFEYFDEIVGPPENDLFLLRWKTRWTAITGARGYFDKITEELVDPERLTQSADPFLAAVGHAYRRYERALLEANRTDFAHLQRLVYDLLRNADTADAVTHDLRYVLVDEYQDTNYIQEQLLVKLTETSRNLCVVGDEDQSLYRFRGATVRNILEFPQRLPGCATVKLTTNYRSHRAIVERYDGWMASTDWSNPSGASFRYDKMIEANAAGTHPDYPSVIAIWGKDRRDEAARFADLVEFLKKNDVIADYGQVALLLHSVREEHSGPYLTALEARGIPAFCPRARAYFEIPEVRDLVACFAVLFGWHGNGRGRVGGAVAELATYVDDAIVQLARRFGVPHPLAEALQRWTGQIAALQEGQSLDLRPADYLYHLLALDPFKSAVRNENIARNLAIFSQLLNVFQSYYHYTVVTHKNREFLRFHFFNSFLRLLYDGGINEYEDPDQPFPKGHVQVMTIHQAKGLEFPVVVVGSLSTQLSSPKRIDRDLGPFYHRPRFEPENRITLFDRMRLHYVAFSRPQKVLVLTAHEPPKDHFTPIWQGLPQWPYVQKELLAAQRFEVRDRVPVKKTYSFTGDLKIYETCPRQYQFFREYDFTPSRSAVIFFGLLVHQTIEEIHRIALDRKLDTLDEPRIRELFERTFRFLVASDVRPIGDEARDAALTQVLNYFHQNRDEMNRVIQTEVDVSLEKDGYILAGKVDLLLGGDGKLELLDFKTSPRPTDSPQLIAAYERQLCTYAHILERRHGRHVDRLLLYWTSEPRKTDALMVLPHDPTRVEEAGLHFDETVRCIEAREFAVAKPPEAAICKECDLRMLCHADGIISQRDARLMVCDYDAIRRDNERRYGTDIGRIGPILLANRYDDRTHFIFELLQNAEDALARRVGWHGSRAVSFHLTAKTLRISHFGLPFDEPDVRGICGIAESTKELTAIGRFGIGFKSVYAFTDRPEVHSGTEAFAIERFVWPVAASALEHDPDETVIAIPLNATDESGHDEIAHGLGRLGASALLFLRQIEEIRWSVEGGQAGLYLRESIESGSQVRRVTVIGQEQGRPELDQTWLVFSRTVTAKGGQHAGHVELAFSVTKDEDSGHERIQRVDRSPLAVFFPTVLETHLGFLVQGPYRTTPSRDNVPRSDDWNQRLVGETASLLSDALCWLRDNDLLDAAGLRCLPLDPAKFREASMFAPLYDATKSALSSECLLPRFDAGHVAAPCARIGRTQELRGLFTPVQLAALYEEQGELVWLSGDITQDRAPELRRFLMQELDVPELTSETVIPRLDRGFLERQSDDWIEKLYEFLSGQPGLQRRFELLPLIRLENGTHVPSLMDGQPQAFLPGPIATGFPVVRAAVCHSATSLEFLSSLGLTQPDPVDDVVRNVLPRYRADEVDAGHSDYEGDVGRILNAFGTDSKGQREKLLAALRETAFVMAVDAGDGSKRASEPGEVYLATERFRELFAGVDGVLLVDDAYACLRGEGIRELLEACGTTRSLQAIPVKCHLSWEERTEIRRNAGLERSTWEGPIADVALRGLDGVLSVLPKVVPVERQRRAALLWDALADVESRRGSRTFVAEYTWRYSHETKTATFDAAFVKQLLKEEWVPDADGNLHRPGLVVFDTLGWKPNPFLLSKIRFKPPIIDQLAKEAGIEPGVLDLLKKLGVTSEADLRSRLGVNDDAARGDSDAEGDVQDALEKLLGGVREPTAPVPDPAGQDPVASDSGADGAGRGAGVGSGSERKPGGGARGDENTKGQGTGARSTGGKRTPGSPGGRPFTSYVATHPEDEAPDPDGLDQPARMALETKAIEFILSHETGWQRTATHNPGFDLFEPGPDEQPARWCEVKAMTGSLKDRPVGMSRTQFDAAREHGDAYWLYVVEQADTGNARIVRVQDPAGKARTFTFDHGWLDVAEVDRDEEHGKD